MKISKLLVFCASLPLVFNACCSDVAVTCAPVDPLLKVFPENTVFLQTPDTLDAAGATHVEFQFALHSNMPVRNFKVECAELTGPDGNLIPAPKVGVVGYVGASEVTNEPAHDALRSATGMFPDPILEQDSYDFDPFMTFCPWITVYVPEGTPEGVYTAAVKMTGKAGRKRFSFEKKINVKVWPVSMCKPDFPNVNWAFDFDHCLELWNGGKPVERFSDDHKEYLKQLYVMMAQCYQNTVMLPVWNVVKMDKKQDGRWEFDFEIFDEYVRLADQAGVLKFIQVEELGHRLVPSWTAPMGLFAPVWTDGKQDKETYAPDDPIVRDFYSSFIPALKAHIEELGWADRCYMKICDEPVDENSRSYCEAVGLIREFWPEMKVLEACQTTKITGAVNAWCPQLDYWHNHYDFYKERQQKGDQVWFYTCCYPRAAYPNRFIEQPLLKTRILSWMAYKYGADGYLHWGFNYWVGDPFVETSMPGTGTSLPGGDSWIIYPGNRRMLRSIRFEQHRDGIEDLTLLKMLAGKDKDRADAIANSLITNWWVYAGSPSSYRGARRELLKALSE